MREVMIRRVRRLLILSAITGLCAACGVRGPLTVNPAPVKGLSAEQLAAASDLRANPSTNVLFGADGKKTVIIAPENK